MPLFEYQCPKCKRITEYRLMHAAKQWTDKHGIYCDDCDDGDVRLEQLISRPASFPVGKYGKAGGLK